MSEMTAAEALAVLMRDCAPWVDPDGTSWCEGCNDPFPCEHRQAVDVLAAEIERGAAIRQRLEMMAKSWHGLLNHELVNSQDRDHCTDLVCIQNRAALAEATKGEGREHD